VGDRRQFAFVVVGRLLQQRADRDRSGGSGEQRVAVGRSLRDDVRAYHAARARTVVRYDLLIEQVRELLRDDAPCEIRRLSRRPRYDHTQRSIRIMLLRQRRAPNANAMKTNAKRFMILLTGAANRATSPTLETDRRSSLIAYHALPSQRIRPYLELH